MRTMGAFIVSVVVALVVISALTGRDAAQRVVTGTVDGYVNGQWISVANETTDPAGFQIALRETTAWEGNPVLIKRGIRVTVWYRSVAERRPVADKVRVFTIDVSEADTRNSDGRDPGRLRRLRASDMGRPDR
jgi:hypothetical protein